MTTRFSIAELADMLHVPVELVREAADSLASEFTAESFIYNERSWRIAPSDVKRIQDWLVAKQNEGMPVDRKRVRRVTKKRVMPENETSE